MVNVIVEMKVRDFTRLLPRAVQRHSKKNQKENLNRKQSRIREGDVLFVPPGLAHWIFNRGHSDLVVVSLYDFGNSENQLDPLFRVI